MSMNEPSLPQKDTALHEALGTARVPHAFGGALALAYYAQPRATIDIDVNIFLPPSRFERIAKALVSLDVDTAIDGEAVTRDGQVRLRWGRTPIDVFLAYDQIHDEMRATFRRVPFADGAIPIIAPEYLAVCKAVFDRPKDWIDIEQMLLGTDAFDRLVAESALHRLVGEADDRARRMCELLDREFG